VGFLWNFVNDLACAVAKKQQSNKKAT